MGGRISSIDPSVPSRIDLVPSLRPTLMTLDSMSLSLSGTSTVHIGCGISSGASGSSSGIGGGITIMFGEWLLPGTKPSKPVSVCIRRRRRRRWPSSGFFM